MWSLGIMIYEMCVGYRPTDWAGYKYGKNKSLNIIGSEPIPFPKRDWKVVSEHAQDCLLYTSPSPRDS